MKVFVIHRFEDNKKLKEKIKRLSSQFPYKIKFVFLDSFNDSKWKMKARKHIMESDLSIIYREDFCHKSENAKWEVELVKKANKEILSINSDTSDEVILEELNLIYNFTSEFNSNFHQDKNDVVELYKIMVNSSEKLIERRQKTNAFFITVIGALIAVMTFIIESRILQGSQGYTLIGFTVVALLICKSWYNLIDNYGKLNKAKFDVILKLEEKMDAQIYYAEWIALGKGVRPKKYKSFTSTEKNVPIYFGILFIIYIVIYAIICLK